MARNLSTASHILIQSYVVMCCGWFNGVGQKPDHFKNIIASAWRLQSVLHAAARLITGIRHNEHITPTLRDTLHSLPISQRITFNIALMMFDCSRGRCPKYFGDVYTPVYTPLLLVRDCDQPTTMTSSSHVHGPLGLAAAVSACADQQFGKKKSHKICEVLTLGNSLNVSLRTGYLSVHTAGGASDRCWLKACRINGLINLLTYLLT